MSRIALSNIDLAVHALYQMGGSERYVHTEDVALECYRAFPDRFSWTKYPQYPDVAPVRFALEDAAKGKYGGLTQGNRRDGWLLTARGIDHARQVAGQLASGESKEDVHSAARRQEVQRFLNDLERHQAFQKFLTSGGCEAVEPYEFTDFLRCTLDSSPAKIRERLEVVRSRAHDAGRARLLSFLEACAARFADLTGEGESG